GPDNALSLEAFRAQPSFHAPAGPSYIAFAPPEEPEPDVVSQRREHQVEKVAKRDESKAKRIATIAKAKRDIDEFYEQYNGKKEHQIRENQFQRRESEANYRSNITHSLFAGTRWSRTYDLISLQHSQSKAVARAGLGTTDLARYDEILFRLRKQGDKAP
ncbi:hypothetical protein FRC06_007228, partial [Ceratobasidium sp. 370]